jgi:hypothetical protein
VPLLHYRSGLLNKRAQVSTLRWNVLTHALATPHCRVHGPRRP